MQHSEFGALGRSSSFAVESEDRLVVAAVPPEIVVRAPRPALERTSEVQSGPVAILRQDVAAPGRISTPMANYAISDTMWSKAGRAGSLEPALRFREPQSTGSVWVTGRPPDPVGEAGRRVMAHTPKRVLKGGDDQSSGGR